MKRIIHQTKYYLTIIILLALLVWLCTSCNLKKHVQKSENKQEINSHVAETSTTTTTYTGNLVIEADSSERTEDAEPFLDGKPIVTETDNFISTTHFDKETKTVKTKFVQKPKSVPISGTVTTAGSKISDTKIKTENKEIIKDKKVSTLPWWIWLLLALLLIYGCWKVKHKLTK